MDTNNKTPKELLVETTFLNVVKNCNPKIKAHDLRLLIITELLQAFGIKYSLLSAHDWDVKEFVFVHNNTIKRVNFPNGSAFKSWLMHFRENSTVNNYFFSNIFCYSFAKQLTKLKSEQE
jgi:hypothetical protein